MRVFHTWLGEFKNEPVLLDPHGVQLPVFPAGMLGLEIAEELSERVLFGSEEDGGGLAQ